ncbi:MAG: hypothetical protein JST12_18320 [Armatimonadetes bacterium]|nr:hypothetical protein [Armatimonadota bacterium]
MVFAFSTSSAIASVAVFDAEGRILFAEEKAANMQASSACFEMLDRAGFDPKLGALFLADIGPGSFTGTRVGVAIAKTLAYVAKAQCAGATSFDLVASDLTVVLPSKKNEWFVREPGQEPYRTTSLPEHDFVGFGKGIDHETFPLAARFAALLPHLKRTSPEEFVPTYLIEPSISVQKKGLGLAGGTA